MKKFLCSIVLSGVSLLSQQAYGVQNICMPYDPPAEETTRICNETCGNLGWAGYATDNNSPPCMGTSDRDSTINCRECGTDQDCLNHFKCREIAACVCK